MLRRKQTTTTLIVSASSNGSSNGQNGLPNGQNGSSHSQNGSSHSQNGSSHSQNGSTARVGARVGVQRNTLSSGFLRFRRRSQKESPPPTIGKNGKKPTRRIPKVMAAAVLLIPAFFLVGTVVGYIALERIQKRSSTNRRLMKTTIHWDDYDISRALETPLHIAEVRIPILVEGLSEGEFFWPEEMDEEDVEEGEIMEFGDLHLRLLDGESSSRQIYRSFWELESSYRSLDAERDDDLDQYYAFDDDGVRNPYSIFDEEHAKEGRCLRTSWHRMQPLSCNSVHELDLSSGDGVPEFVGEGSFREVFKIAHDFLGTDERLILKQSRWELEFEYDNYEYIRMDALVSERLSSNPLIVDIYGYCGLTILSELFEHGDIEDVIIGQKERHEDMHPEKEPELLPYNDLTGKEKLHIAKQMVEAVSALHNFKDGVIVHDDIQIVQFLWTEDEKNIKLNDFNRAEIMFWDVDNQEYCKYRNGKGHGDWRAPEEYYDEPLDEKIDMFSIGNNIFSLITGLYPFYDVEEEEDIQRNIRHGERPLMDQRYRNRSVAEDTLIELLERCWEYYPSNRISSAEALEMLEAAEASLEED